MTSSLQGAGGTIFLLTDNSTQSGEWDTVSLGAQAPNPASWMGYGLSYLANNQANINVIPISLSDYPSSYTQTLDDNGICSALGSVTIWTSGEGTYVMLPSSAVGIGFTFTLLNIGTGNLTFYSSELTDTYNGVPFATTLPVLGPQQSVTLATDGAGNFYGYNAQAALSGVYGPLTPTTPGDLVTWASTEGGLIADAGFSLPSPLAPVPASILTTTGGSSGTYILTPQPFPVSMGGTGAVSLQANGAVVTNPSGTVIGTALGSAGQILTANATGGPTFAYNSGNYKNIIQFVSDSLWTPPAGITFCKMTCIGGGGSGFSPIIAVTSNGFAATLGGNGGGGGHTIIAYIAIPANVTKYAITIGSGGESGVEGQTGDDGEETNVAQIVNNLPTIIIETGYGEAATSTTSGGCNILNIITPHSNFLSLVGSTGGVGLQCAIPSSGEAPLGGMSGGGGGTSISPGTGGNYCINDTATVNGDNGAIFTGAGGAGGVTVSLNGGIPSPASGGSGASGCVIIEY